MFLLGHGLDCRHGKTVHITTGAGLDCLDDVAIHISVGAGTVL
jgi:hypothetical protein